MNIILANGDKVPMIKGWPLEGNRVVAVHGAALNGNAIDVFVTKRNFYMHLSGAWYNGGLVSAKSEHAEVLPLLEAGKAVFRTSRSYDVTTPEVDLSHLTGEPKAEATEAPAPVASKEEEVLELERIMKKEAREALESGSKVFAVKFHPKKKEYLEETLTELTGDFDEAVETFYADHAANKSNIHFRVAK